MSAPSETLNEQSLPIIEIDPKRLFRISQYKTNEPFFGRKGSNRFDDPLGEYGTCYCGNSLVVAIAESILHNELPRLGEHWIDVRRIMSAQVVRFPHATGTLRLAHFTGANLRFLVGPSDIIGGLGPFCIPQAWSRALYEHPQDLDGIFYMSRHINDEAAVVVFERAQAKLGPAVYQDLPDVEGGLAATIRLRIIPAYGTPGRLS